MKTKTITLYSFDELSEKAQQKAIKELYDINVDHKWYDSTFDQLKSELSERGFDNAEIHFSGFWSQGDGACFDADISLEKFCSDKRILAIAKEYCHFHIAKNSFANHYSHQRTRYVEYNAVGKANIDNALSELSKVIESQRLSLSHEIYRALEKEYDHLTSKEAIIETINANEWTFTKDGKLENI